MILGTHEHFVVVAADSLLRPIDATVLTTGTSRMVQMDPGDVFRWVFGVKVPVVHIAVAHGHPSGDPAPSPDDRRLTSRLVLATRILSLTLVDHLIIGAGSYCGMAGRGELA